MAHSAEKMEAEFRSFDTDNDGFITAEELANLLKRLGMFESMKQVRRLIAEVDTNRNGTVELAEFLMMAEGLQGGGFMTVRKGAAQRERQRLVQEKSFCRWTNYHLADRGRSIANLHKGLSDGLELIQLLEIISDKQLPRANKKPRFSIQRIGNLNIALTFLHEENIKLVNIGSEDIEASNLTCILGLMWTIILRYHIQKGLGSSGGAKSKLLKWVNRTIASDGLKVVNFTSSFEDPRVICSLANSLGPKINIDISKVNMRDAEEAIHDAITQAHKHYGIALLMDAADFLGDVDELSMMTYISCYQRESRPESAKTPQKKKVRPQRSPSPVSKPAAKPAPQGSDLDRVRGALGSLLDGDRDGSLRTAIMHLAWNSSATWDRKARNGGSQGATMRFAPEKDDVENAGLEAVRERLFDISKGTTISQADIWILASYMVLERFGGSALEFTAGRRDQPNARGGPPAGRLSPGAPSTGSGAAWRRARQLRIMWYRMGFNDREIVALMAGGHCFGRSHPGRSGRSWSSGATRATNQYCRALLGNRRFSDRDQQGAQQMTVDDDALAQDRRFRSYIRGYAADEGLLLRDFGLAFKKLTELGFVADNRDTATADASMSRALGSGLEDGAAGMREFTVEMKDGSGKPLAGRAGRTPFEVVLCRVPDGDGEGEAIPAEVEDQGRGTYAVLYDAPPGLYSVEVCVDDTLLPDQPVYVQLSDDGSSDGADVDGARAALNVIFDNDRGTNIRSALVQLAWHASAGFSRYDQTGGSNGATMRFAPERDEADNAGLGIIRERLSVFQEKYRMSHADLWVLAAYIAIERSGGPSLTFTSGRQDFTTSGPVGRLNAGPEPSGPDSARFRARQLRIMFYRLGFGDREAVALMAGGHCYGRGHPGRERGSTWSTETSSMSNQYCRALLGSRKFADRNRRTARQVTVDDEALVQDRRFLTYVRRYAEDEKVFLNDFGGAFQKLTELGFVQDGATNAIGADVSMCSAHGSGLEDGDVGTRAFTVEIQDIDGAPVSVARGAAPFEVQVFRMAGQAEVAEPVPVPVEIQGTGQGVYQVRYDAAEAGLYGVEVSLDDMAFDSMPTYVRVQPGESEADAATAEITSWLASDRTGGIRSALVQLAWNASATYDHKDRSGGADGAFMRFSPEKDDEDNAGLDVFRTQLEGLRTKCPTMSQADLWILAGYVAIGFNGGPMIAFTGGRQDKANSRGGPAAGRLNPGPEPSGSGAPQQRARQLRVYFYRMGFNDREAVALMAGAHCYGRGHPGRARGSTWQSVGSGVNNQYCRALLGSRRFADRGRKGARVMTMDDEALVGDLRFRGYVQRYAEDEPLFVDEFCKAFKKLTELGFVDDKERDGADASMCKVSGLGIEDGDAGSRTFTVEMRDSRGGAVASDRKAPFEVSVTRVREGDDNDPERSPVYMQAQGNGVYDVTYEAPETGRYRVDACLDDMMLGSLPVYVNLEATSDVDYAKAALVSLFPSDRAGRLRAAAELMQLAWNSSATFDAKDCNGGSNGATMRFSPEREDQDNAGLGPVRERLAAIQKKYPRMSHSDLWILAGYVALEQTGGEALSFTGGRVDKDISQPSPPVGRLSPGPVPTGPNAAHERAKQIRAMFYRLGFSDREGVVLMAGGHCYGRGHPGRARGAAWSTHGSGLSNQYCRALLAKRGSRKFADRGRKTNRQEVSHNTGRQLTIDDEALTQDRRLRRHVQRYAESERLMKSDFCKAFKKLTELGFVSAGPDSSNLDAVDVSQCKAYGLGLEDGDAGPRCFTVEIKDGRGRPCSGARGVVPFDVFVSKVVQEETDEDEASQTVPYEVEDKGRGVYEVLYDVPDTGLYCVDVAVDDKALGSLPVFIQLEGESDVDGSKADIAALLSGDSSGALRSALVQLAWNSAATYDWSDGTGGANGATMRFSPEKDDVENAGLGTVRERLATIHDKHPGLSHADLWVLASYVALEQSGGPELEFTAGRQDAPDEDACPPTGRLSAGREPSGAYASRARAQQLRAMWYRLGLNDREAVALMAGGHCYGRGHPNRPRGQTWTSQGSGFSNQYCKALLAGDALADRDRTSATQLTVDDLALQEDGRFRSYLRQFANDENALRGTFGVAFKKLTEAGFVADGAGNRDDVIDVSMCEAHGPGLEDGEAGPRYFTVEMKDGRGRPVAGARDRLPFDLQVSKEPATDFEGQVVPVQVQDKGNGIYGVTYDAPDTGCYRVDATVDDKALGSLPVYVDVEAESDLDAATGELTSLLDNDPNGALRSSFVQLAWNSAATFDKGDRSGGANGATMRFSPEKDDPENAGLADARDRLAAIQKKHPSMSHSDLWVLAGTTALTHSGGPPLAFTAGRMDKESARDGPGAGRLSAGPEPSGPDAPRKRAAQLRTMYYRMGLNDRDVVATTAALHCYGRGHPGKPQGAGWSSEGPGFGHQYCKALVGPRRFTDRDMDGATVMTLDDEAMAQDPQFRKYVRYYADDEDALRNDFGAAFQKMALAGFVDDDSARGDPDASMCKAYGEGLEDGDAGPRAFTVEMKDSSGRPVSGVAPTCTIFKEADEENAAQTVPVELEDQGNGVYGVLYDVPDTGCYSLTASVNDQVLNSFPKYVQLEGESDVDGSKADLAALLADDRDGTLRSALVQLAWNSSATYDRDDGTGGSDGATMRFSPEKDDAENAGLGDVRDRLAAIQKKHPGLSNADLWVLAGYIAVEQSGGPELEFTPGRQDKDSSQGGPPAGRLSPGDEPSGPHAGRKRARQLRSRWYRMGFSDREGVALMAGGHCYGKGHPGKSARSTWNSKASGLNNGYCRALLGGSRRKFADRDSKGATVLTLDDEALIQDRRLRAHVRRYADDEQLLVQDFGEAFKRLTELGFVEGAAGIGETDVDASMCEVHGPGLEDGDAGPREFTIELKDPRGRPVATSPGQVPFDVQVIKELDGETGDGDGESVPVEVEDKGDGVFAVLYDAPDTGSYCIDATLDDKMLGALPVSVSLQGESDLDGAKSDLVALLANDSTGAVRGALVQLAWNSSATYDAAAATGGSNGATMRFSPEQDDPDNAGLGDIRDLLTAIQKKRSSLSLSDLWVLAGYVAIGHNGGPTLQLTEGRQDKRDARGGPAAGLVSPGEDPSGQLAGRTRARQLRRMWYRMGFGDREIVALEAGGHCFGRGHRQRSTRTWSSASAGLSNQYCQALLDGSKRKFADRDDNAKAQTMTVDDEALLMDRRFRSHVRRYAKDARLLENDFAQAFKKLTELGFVDHGAANAHGVVLSKCKAHGVGLEDGDAGPRSFTVEMKDRRGRAVTGGDIPFEVYVSKVPDEDGGFDDEPRAVVVEIKDQGRGAYEVTYDPPETDLHCIDVSVDDQVLDEHPVYVQLEGVSDVDGSRKDLAALLASDRDGTFRSALVQLAWNSSATYDGNDGSGGSNGATMRFAPEKDDAENAGLGAVRDQLATIQKKYPGLSNADLWVLAGYVALEHSGSPELEFTPGRQDKDSPPPAGRLSPGDEPSGPHAGRKRARQLRSMWYRMGFNDREIVVLMAGGHVYGRGHPDRARGSTWSSKAAGLNNGYCRALVDGGRRRKFADRKKSATTMTVDDEALATDRRFRAHARRYALDDNLFLNDFSRAFKKLTELGFVDNGDAGSADSMDATLCKAYGPGLENGDVGSRTFTVEMKNRSGRAWSSPGVPFQTYITWMATEDDDAGQDEPESLPSQTVEKGNGVFEVTWEGPEAAWYCVDVSADDKMLDVLPAYVQLEESETDLDALKADLAAMMAKDRSGGLRSALVQLAWNSSATYDKKDRSGGSNGATMRFAPEKDEKDNAGLGAVRDRLVEIQKRYRRSSHGDLWVLASYVALEQTGCGAIAFTPGREDRHSGHGGPPVGRLSPGEAPSGPNADRDRARQLRRWWYRMGFCDREAVALMAGGHCYGRGHPGRRGKTWSSEASGLNNQYCRALVGGRRFADRNAKYIDRMTPDDKALVKDRRWRRYIRRYANDESLLRTDFSKAFKKLTELGCVEGEAGDNRPDAVDVEFCVASGAGLEHGDVGRRAFTVELKDGTGKPISTSGRDVPFTVVVSREQDDTEDDESTDIAVEVEAKGNGVWEVTYDAPDAGWYCVDAACNDRVVGSLPAYVELASTEPDMDAIRADLEALMGEDGICAALVQLAWHSSATYDKNDRSGGSNGATMRFSPEQDDAMNGGLGAIRDRLASLQQQHPNISFGDLWVFASYVAIHKTGGPKMDFVRGRVDRDGSRGGPPAGRLSAGELPTGDGAGRQWARLLRRWWYRMGFNDREAVALMAGGHCYGRGHPGRRGKTWHTEAFGFSNQYCRALLRDRKFADRNAKYVDRVTVDDMALFRDRRFRRYIRRYARDEELYKAEFGKAFKKLTELGFVDGAAADNQSSLDWQVSKAYGPGLEDGDFGRRAFTVELKDSQGNPVSDSLSVQVFRDQEGDEDGEEDEQEVAVEVQGKGVGMFEVTYDGPEGGWYFIDASVADRAVADLPAYVELKGEDVVVPMCDGPGILGGSPSEEGIFSVFAPDEAGNPIPMATPEIAVSFAPSSAADVQTMSRTAIILEAGHQLKQLRGHLGVKLLDGPTRRGVNGALVQEVIKDGPAYQANILVGDIILAINGTRLNNKKAAGPVMKHVMAGDVIMLTTLRKDKVKRVPAVLASKDAPLSRVQALSRMARGDVRPGDENILRVAGSPRKRKPKSPRTVAKSKKLPVQVKAKRDNTYQVSFPRRQPGEYTVDVLVGGQHISSSPYSFIVADDKPKGGRANAAKCTARGSGLDSGSLSAPSSVLITACDDKGVPVGNAAVGVEVLFQRALTLDQLMYAAREKLKSLKPWFGFELVDASDSSSGPRVSSVDPKGPAGQTEVDIKVGDTTLYANGVKLKASRKSFAPVAKASIPGDIAVFQLSRKRTTIKTRMMVGTRALDMVTLGRLVRLSKGNQPEYRLTELDLFTASDLVQVSSPEQIPAHLVDNGDGTFTARYTRKEPGVYSVFVRVDGEEIPGSAFNVQVA